MLHDFIRDHRHAIVERARGRVSSRRVPVASDVEIANGVPLFLSQLVSLLREQQCRGLPDLKENALFHSFERRGADRTGLGLGLKISRDAVKADGGEIRVRNLPGKGCVFTIELPITPA